MEKICSRCSKYAVMAAGRSYCKECNRIKTAQWRASNMERSRHLLRKSQFKIKYGLPPEAYEEMATAQNNVCYLCKGPQNKKGVDRLGVDHCHETGTVRKLLCQLCNMGLGAFRDNPELLREAAAYIEAHRGD